MTNKLPDSLILIVAPPVGARVEISQFVRPIVHGRSPLPWGRE